MSNVSAGSKDDWITVWLLVIVMKQLGNIVDLMEQRNPTIVVSVVLRYLFRSVVVAEFVWTRIVL